MLLATVYFASLAFFVLEHKVNPLVTDYGDALWWAFMDVTTVGSNIIAMTTTGRVLSVLLAALGMMMFPIFTVYITNLIHASVDPKTVQYLAGHENSKITMDIYAKAKYNRPVELAGILEDTFTLWDAE